MCIVYVSTQQRSAIPRRRRRRRASCLAILRSPADGTAVCRRDDDPSWPISGTGEYLACFFHCIRLASLGATATWHSHGETLARRLAYRLSKGGLRCVSFLATLTLRLLNPRRVQAGWFLSAGFQHLGTLMRQSLQNARCGEKCAAVLTQVTRLPSDRYVRTSLMCADRKPQCSSVTTGTYQLLCFFKALGKPHTAVMKEGVKGDSEGFNTSFL